MRNRLSRLSARAERRALPAPSTVRNGLADQNGVRLSFRFMLPADYSYCTRRFATMRGVNRVIRAQALRVGLAEIGFIDHSPMQQDEFR